MRRGYWKGGAPSQILKPCGRVFRIERPPAQLMVDTNEERESDVDFSRCFFRLFPKVA